MLPQFVPLAVAVAAIGKRPVPLSGHRWIMILALSGFVGGCSGGGNGTDISPSIGAAFCDTRAFTPAGQSPYVLPYSSGVTYTMFQGNCSPPPGGHQTTFAYDFDHSMGDPVTAAGDVLGLAGNSGASSGPHLHFQVFETNTSFNNEDAVPVTFSNAVGRTGNNGELLEGEPYTAN